MSCLVVAAAGIGGFIWRELRARYPMVQLSYFRRAAFAAGVSSGWLIYLVIFGILYVVPYYLERGQGLSSSITGVELLVMPFALGVMAPISGSLADRLGPRPLMLGGMSLSAALLILMGISHPTGAPFLIELALVGAGLGASTAPNNAATMGALPQTASGMASGVLNMARGLGTAMGLAITELVFVAAAGSRADVPGLVKNGFSHAAVFLGLVAAVTLVVTVFRQNGELRYDPMSQVE